MSICKKLTKYANNCTTVEQIRVQLYKVDTKCKQLYTKQCKTFVVVLTRPDLQLFLQVSTFPPAPSPPPVYQQSICPNPTKMCVSQKLNQPGRTWVVKKLYSELFLILSRSSKSTPVFRPWEVRWLWKACSLINFHNVDKNHPCHPCWGRKTQRKAAKMVSILIINWIYIGTWFYLKSSRLTNRTVRMALSGKKDVSLEIKCWSSPKKFYLFLGAVNLCSLKKLK